MIEALCPYDVSRPQYVKIHIMYKGRYVGQNICYYAWKEIYVAFFNIKPHDNIILPTQEFNGDFLLFLSYSLVFLAPMPAVTDRGNIDRYHDDVIKLKHYPRYWPFVRGIHRSPVNSSHKGQWRGALMFSLICTPINGRVNNGEVGDFRRHRAHDDVTVMT